MIKAIKRFFGLGKPAVAKVVDEVDEKIPESKVGGWDFFLKGDHLVITERT